MIAIRRRRPSRRGRATRWSHALRAARSLWLSSDSVNRGEFSSFARSLNLSDRYPGLQGIGWRTVVTDGRAAGFVARTRRVGEPTFTIKPPGRRPVYYVTVYSYPRIPFSSPLGADARTVPSIVTPLEQARDTGQTTLSNQTTLPGDLDLPPDRRPVAFELFVPVYRGDESGDGVAERRRRFLGWATGLPGNAVLTERTIPAPLVVGIGLAISVLLGVLLWLLAQVGALYHEVGRLGGPAAQDRPAGPLRRPGVRGAPARLRAGQRHGDRERLRTAPSECTCSIGVAAWDGREAATGSWAEPARVRPSLPW